MEAASSSDKPEASARLASHDKPEVDRDAFLDEIRQRLEELFARENLAKDVFIRQQMSVQLDVPICVLPGHPRVASLGPGADVAALLEAAKRSDKVIVDEVALLIRPVLKPRRNALILHDLPAGVAVWELRELFERSPESEALCSVKPDINRTAFVAFRDDDAAQRAALWLRSQTLRGESLQCSIKSEQLVKGFFPATPPPAPVQTQDSLYRQQVMMWGYPVADQQWAVGEDAVMDPTWGGEIAGWASGADGESEGGKGKSKGKGKRMAATGAPAGAGDPHHEAEGGAGCRSRSASQSSTSLLDRFLDDSLEAATGDASNDWLVECVGYTREFRKYSRQQIIEVCSGMDEVSKPETFARLEREDENLALFRQEPCKDWAPLPTPPEPLQHSFASGEGRRASGEDGDADRGRGGTRPRKGEWNDSADWSWDGWHDEQGQAGRRKSRTRSSWDSSWDWHGGEQRWVEKNSKGEDSDAQADVWEGWSSQTESWPSEQRARDRVASWSDKVKGSLPRWQAKSKGEAVQEADSTGEPVAEEEPVAAPAEATVASLATPAPADDAEVATDAHAGGVVGGSGDGGGDRAAEGGAAPPPAAPATARPAPPAAMSWADKVRQGSQKAVAAK